MSKAQQNLVFVLGTALSTGPLACSSTDDAPESDAIWSDGATGASLSVKGGMQGKDEAFAYDRAKSTLRYSCQHFCYTNGTYQNDPIDFTVTLSPSDDHKLRDQLRALHESTDPTRCYLDAYERVLGITSSKGSVKSYQDDATAGCGGAPTSQPLIATEDISALQSLLEQLAFQ